MITRVACVSVSLLAVVLGCGGQVSDRAATRADVGPWSDPDAKAAGDDGGSRSDAYDSTDAADDESSPDDSSSTDDGPDVPPCREDRDCDGIGATCQSGYCCAGTYANGECTCGSGPGCDVLHICCMDQCSVDCVLPP